MAMLLVIMLAILIGVLICVYLAGRKDNLRKPRRPKLFPPDANKAGNWHWRAVKVQPGLIACHRIQKLVNNRYLSIDAPPLPLPDCTEKRCVCKYLFLNDRREGIDRRNYLSQYEVYAKSYRQNRRDLLDRRAIG